jgi:hypothetical protein
MVEKEASLMLRLMAPSDYIDASADIGATVGTVSTDAQGLQFYTGNYLSRTVGGDGWKYRKHSGLGLEPGAFPNAPIPASLDPHFFDMGLSGPLREDHATQQNGSVGCSARPRFSTLSREKRSAYSMLSVH